MVYNLSMTGKPQNKAILGSESKPESSERSWFFADIGVTVIASSIEEAKEKLAASIHKNK